MNVDISIIMDENVKEPTVKAFKEKVLDAFNAVAQDIRNHGAEIKDIAWLIREARASISEENIDALAKTLAPKGFTVKPYTSSPIKKDL